MIDRSYRRKLPLSLLLVVPTGAIAGSDTIRYQYDALGRLQSSERRAVNGQGFLNTYSYDPASNRSRVQSSGPFKGATLAGNMALLPGGSLLSTDGRFRLTFQFDGNLALYGPQDNLMWQTNTSGSGATQLSMQSDGNLVLYSPQQAIWSTGTWGQGASHLSLQSDGNLVIYRESGGSSWNSGTCCS